MKINCGQKIQFKIKSKNSVEKFWSFEKIVLRTQKSKLFWIVCYLSALLDSLLLSFHTFLTNPSPLVRYIIRGQMSIEFVDQLWNKKENIVLSELETPHNVRFFTTAARWAVVVIESKSFLLDCLLDCLLAWFAHCFL